MDPLNKLFENPTRPLHPRVRAWLGYLTHGNETVEVHRESDGLVERTPRIFLNHVENGGQRRQEETDWSDELNAALVDKGVRAFDSQNETTRFGLTIGAMLRPLEIKSGDGYFNVVLGDVLRDGPALHPVLQPLMSYVREGNVDRNSLIFAELFESIQGVFKTCASDLTGKLKYDGGVARDILVGAIARYVEDRFHVASRRALGWG